MVSSVYNCKIRTLSPIHIGARKDYGTSEYVTGVANFKKKDGSIVKRNMIDRIDFTKYYSSLPEKQQERFLQSLSNPNFRLEEFDNKIKKEFRRYRSISKVTSKPTDISEHIKTSDLAYIPGSSIKGAIKTAIFYNLLDYEGIYKISDEIIRIGREGKPFINKRDYSFFIDSYFSSKTVKNKAQGSIMRFLQIGDSSTVKIPTVHEVSAIMASSRGGMPDGTQLYSRNGKPVKSYLETIDRNKIVSSDFTINKNDKIIQKLKLEDKKHILDINYIKKSVYEFGEDLIRHELDFAEDYRVDYLVKFYEKLSKFNKKETPILRIGAGSGLMATSIAMKIKNEDPETFDEIRRTFRRSYDYEFPKSRKVTATKMPLSWVQLNFTKKE